MRLSRRIFAHGSHGLQLFDGEKYRFYPLEILAWHELVFDRIGDMPIVVSYARFPILSMRLKPEIMILAIPVMCSTTPRSFSIAFQIRSTAHCSIRVCTEKKAAAR